MAFCTNCGKQLVEGAGFCAFCGTRLAEVPRFPAQKKSRKGLVIGLTVGGTALVAGLVVLILFLTGVFGGNKHAGLYHSLSDEDVYLQLNADGTGTMYEVYFGETQPFTWTDTSITYMGMTAELSFSGDTMTMKFMGEEEVLVKTNEPLPEMPEIPDETEKPVIYLYPEEERDISVQLSFDGRLSCVYPAFDAEGTWRVTARPDGTLFDENGKEYYCLYWEGEGGWTPDFSEGAVVKGEDTAAFLEEALAAQGLTPREANEFIIYWLPQMEDNAYNLISFQTDNYTDAAKLFVEPAPDTVIRVCMSFRALQEEEALTLRDTLPAQTFTAPEREGFILVEWGGCEVK
ncbi:MAG: zinc ribbon domain-containing protein [Lachnospiraceae bacterium]|nr:zinc ribbon domain-containing protein [Lachnospiraceae bacterium]